MQTHIFTGSVGGVGRVIVAVLNTVVIFRLHFLSLGLRLTV